MINGIWGRKIGMTQIFSDNKVVPVTVVDTSNWLITQIKTEANDGYNALQIGCLRKRFQGETFQPSWLEMRKKHFQHVREVRVKSLSEEFVAGAIININEVLKENDKVDVSGVTKGAGFQGVVKRHGFAGARASHGAGFGKHPGGISFMRARGKVIKGKKLPGHMGVKNRTAKNLTIVQVRAEDNLVLVKGSTAGKPGSVVFLRRCE